MDPAASRTKVEWRDWGAAAFADAAERDRPVLIAVTGFWCGWCRAMDGRTYADPRIAARIEDAVVPVRVDADARPLVRARYTMGGLPATVFATPDGKLLASAGYLDPADFREVLERVQESWAEGGVDAGRIPEPLEDTGLPGGAVTPDIERQLVGQLDAQFDAEQAGWGSETKFPLPETVGFALARRPEQATRTLDRVLTALEDPGDGGFFRHAQARDWTEPMLEKLLSVNAGLLQVLADAYLVTGEETYRRAGERTVTFLETTLWTGDGFANSQAPGEYFSREPADRDPQGEPPVDANRYADTNARAVAALLRFYGYTDSDPARALGEAGLDWLLESCLSDGLLDHAPDRSAGPTLFDQAAGLAALTTASQVLGPEPYRDYARRLADRTIDALQTDEGAFRDGPAEGSGLLSRPLHPIDENARLADALVDLSYLTREDSYRSVAEEAIAAFADAADHLGVQAASYGRAAARLVEQPLVLAIETPPGSDLHRAALRMADHEKVVLPGAAVSGPGLASILGVSRSGPPIKTPADLASAVQAAFE